MPWMVTVLDQAVRPPECVKDFVNGVSFKNGLAKTGRHQTTTSPTRLPNCEGKNVCKQENVFQEAKGNVDQNFRTRRKGVETTEHNDNGEGYLGGPIQG